MNTHDQEWEWLDYILDDLESEESSQLALLNDSEHDKVSDMCSF